MTSCGFPALAETFGYNSASYSFRVHFLSRCLLCFLVVQMELYCSKVLRRCKMPPLQLHPAKHYFKRKKVRRVYTNCPLSRTLNSKFMRNQSRGSPCLQTCHCKQFTHARCPEILQRSHTTTSRAVMIAHAHNQTSVYEPRTG